MTLPYPTRSLPYQKSPFQRPSQSLQLPPKKQRKYHKPSQLETLYLLERQRRLLKLQHPNQNPNQTTLPHRYPQTLHVGAKVVRRHTILPSLETRKNAYITLDPRYFTRAAKAGHAVNVEY